MSPLSLLTINWPIVQRINVEDGARCTPQLLLNICNTTATTLTSVLVELHDAVIDYGHDHGTYTTDDLKQLIAIIPRMTELTSIYINSEKPLAVVRSNGSDTSLVIPSSTPPMDHDHDDGNDGDDDDAKWLLTLPDEYEDLVYSLIEQLVMSLTRRDPPPVTLLQIDARAHDDDERNQAAVIENARRLRAVEDAKRSAMIVNDVTGSDFIGTTSTSSPASTVSSSPSVAMAMVVPVHDLRYPSIGVPPLPSRVITRLGHRFNDELQTDTDWTCDYMSIQSGDHLIEPHVKYQPAPSR